MTKKKYVIQHKYGGYVTQFARVSNPAKAMQFDSFRAARQVALGLNREWSFDTRVKKHHRAVPPFAVKEVLVTQ